MTRSSISDSSAELFFFPSNAIPLVQGLLITTKHSRRDGEEPHEKLEGIGGATHSTLGVGGGYTWCRETLQHHSHYSLCNLRNLNIFLLTEISQWLTTEPFVHSSWLKDCINVPAGRRSRPTYQHAVLLTSTRVLVVGLMLAAAYTRKGTHTRPFESVTY